LSILLIVVRILLLLSVLSVLFIFNTFLVILFALIVFILLGTSGNLISVLLEKESNTSGEDFKSYHVVLLKFTD
jgi:hypothetical protein